jgi:NAD(P)-dependent dehydrogenase (short-subunit alcohol dehydrogenase family)
MRLKNRVAVVPGGTSGIGKAIALGFAREGATVVVASRSAEKVREAEAELNALGSQGYGTTLDVTDEPSIQKLMSDVKNKYGRIDIMLNSAGAFPACPFLKMTTENWKQVLDLNLNAPFYCAKAVAPIMAEQNYGRIIFISSAQGLRGIPLMAHYTAAKGGIIAFVRCIAAELGPYNITVNAIACGLTMTGPVSGGLHTKEELEFLASTMPNKRLGEADDFTGYALVLASEEGSHITAQTLAIDGGMTQAQAVMANLYQ